MKQFSTLLLGGALLLAMPMAVRAQSVGVGTTAPNASAALDVVSSTKGALLPRLTQAQRNAIATPATGLIVFQTDGTGAMGPGFWYNQGTPASPKWLRLADSSGISYDPTTGLQVGPGPVGAGSLGSVGTPGGATPTIYYPYRGSWNDMRVLFLYRASDLLANGLHTGPITQIEFNIATKSSTQPYNGYTIQISNTAATTAPTAFPAAGSMTTVHNSNFTTVAGWNAHPFNAGSFSWDGTSNVLVQVCYDNAASTTSDLPYITAALGYVAAYGVADNTNATPGCTMTSGGGGDASPNTSLPVTRFTQPSASYSLPPTAGTAGQVLTQQASGAVTFQDPQWRQTGTDLYPNLLTSDVGVGTTTPNQKLDVASGGIRAGSFGAFAGVAATDQGAHLQWNRSGSEGETWLINHIGLGGANAGIRFAGITTSTGTAPTEWARFLNNGNFGIGTAAPAQKLDVNGNANVTGILQLNTTDVDKIFLTNQGVNGSKIGHAVGWGVLNYAGPGNSATTGFHSWLTTTGNVYAEQMRLTTAGLGIGTTAPTAKLQVVAADNSTNTYADFQPLNLTQGVGVWYGGLRKTGTNPTSDFAIDGKSTGNIVLNANGGTGNVGIGTNVPSQKLDVRGSVRLGDDGGTAATGTGNAIEFVGPGVNSDIIGFYRTNPASNASELRAVVGDDPTSYVDRLVVGTTNNFSGPDQLTTGTFTPQFTVLSSGAVVQSVLTAPVPTSTGGFAPVAGIYRFTDNGTGINGIVVLATGGQMMEGQTVMISNFDPQNLTVTYAGGNVNIAQYSTARFVYLAGVWTRGI